MPRKHLSPANRDRLCRSLGDLTQRLLELVSPVQHRVVSMKGVLEREL